MNASFITEGQVVRPSQEAVWDRILAGLDKLRARSGNQGGAVGLFARRIVGVAVARWGNIGGRGGRQRPGTVVVGSRDQGLEPLRLHTERSLFNGSASRLMCLLNLLDCKHLVHEDQRF